MFIPEHCRSKFLFIISFSFSSAKKKKNEVNVNFLLHCFSFSYLFCMCKLVQSLRKMILSKNWYMYFLDLFTEEISIKEISSSGRRRMCHQKKEISGHCAGETDHWNEWFRMRWWKHWSIIHSVLYPYARRSNTLYVV